MHLRDGFLADQLDPIYVAYNMWTCGLKYVKHAPYKMWTFCKSGNIVSRCEIMEVECLTKHKNLLWKDVFAQKWQQTNWQNFELKTRKTWKPNIKEVQLIGFINLFFGGRIDPWTLIKRSPWMILNPTDQLFCRISTFNIFGFLLWNWAALSL